MNIITEQAVVEVVGVSGLRGSSQGHHLEGGEGRGVDHTPHPSPQPHTPAIGPSLQTALS